MIINRYGTEDCYSSIVTLVISLFSFFQECTVIGHIIKICNMTKCIIKPLSKMQVIS